MLNWMVHLKGGPKRACHAAVTVGHKVYSFGGFCTMETYRYDRGYIDVHVFNAVSLSWTKLPAVKRGRATRRRSRPPLTQTPGSGGEHPLDIPSMRYGHTAALTEDVIYLWGGIVDSEVEEYCNVLYKFHVDTHRWFKPRTSGTVPETRRNHSACVLGKVMYIFGGFNERTRYTNNIYKLDTTTMVWSLINSRGTPPPVSECHSATIIGTKVYVFGGQASNIYYNIRVFDTETNSWLSTDSAQILPEGRECHSAFAYNGELYIFGGQNCQRYELFNDLWKFNPETFSWKNVEPKGLGPCSWMYRMCCCMVGDRIILFGGNTDDLYVLDLSPSLKALCKLAVIQYGLKQSELPHDIRWELAAMTTNPACGPAKKKRRRKYKKIIEVTGNGTEEMERRGYWQPSKVG